VLGSQVSKDCKQLAHPIILSHNFDSLGNFYLFMAHGTTPECANLFYIAFTKISVFM
jgi:hypothetical protein